MMQMPGRANGPRGPLPPGGAMPPGQPRVNFSEMINQMEEMDRERLRAAGVTQFMDNIVRHPSGREITRLNLGMLHDNKITPENLEKIKSIHIQRYNVLETIGKAPTKELAKQWEDLELQLQEAWGKMPSRREFRFWTLPGCTCPKRENELRFPSDDFIRDPACPLHG